MPRFEFSTEGGSRFRFQKDYKMERVDLVSSDSPELHIDAVTGSLQLKAWPQKGIRIELQHKEDLTYNFEGDALHLTAHGDCIVRAPNGSFLQIEMVTKDAYVSGIEGEIHVQEISGSLTLRAVGESHIETVNGNLTARGVEGDIMVDEVSGNVTLRDIEGDVEIKEVHGNLSLRDLEGGIQAKADGNADMHLTEDVGDCDIRSGGNAFCNLDAPGDAEVSLESEAQNIHVNTSSGKQQVQTRKHAFTLGSGSKTIEISAGGHIDFRCLEGETFTLDLDLDALDNVADLAGEIGDHVTAQMESQLEGLNAQLEALSERLRNSGDRAARHAQQRVAAAQRKLERRMRTSGGRAINIATKKSADPVTEKERMLILQMVQEKKITVQEAEMLLNTLDGRPGASATEAEQQPTKSETGDLEATNAQ